MSIKSGTIGVLAAILIASAAQAAPEGRPLPVSCLYLHDSIRDEGPGKKAGRAEIAGAGIYPARKDRLPEAAPDSFTALVILIDWEDEQSRPTVYPPSHFDRAFFQGTGAGNETVRDYYLENSNGAFRLGGEVEGWYRSALPYGHYVNGDGLSPSDDDYGFDTRAEAFAAEPYPSNVWGIVREAVTLADEGGLDFSRFDSDGDGVVDGVIVIHAGRGAEGAYETIGASQIWSHMSDLNDPAVVAFMGPTEIDGVLVGPYDLVPEIGQTGVYAHEFGHILGLPDLYRTYVSGGATIQESTLGVYCLMDAGSLLPFQATGGTLAGGLPAHFNPFFKSWLGWANPESYEPSSFEGPVTVTMDAIERGGPVVRVLANPKEVDWENGGGTGEYFLLENRDRVGFDAEIPGKGMLVWHINERRASNDSSAIEKRLALLVEAGDGVPGDISSIGDPGYLGEQEDFFPTPLVTDWTPDTDPSTDLYGGRFSGVSVTDIRLNGSRITFDLDMEEGPPGGPYVYPNPWRASGGGEVWIEYKPSDGVGGEPVIEIFDLLGTRVRLLEEEGEIDSDENGAGFQASWDGRNDSGREVASGVYLYVIRTSRETKTGKIAILR
ncbi:MAG: M6 family metalloprotease domain-containing protein [Candidatus Eisenbacteria bacterium]